MGVRNTAVEGKAAMFCSTDGRAFGPVFDSSDELDDFLAWWEDSGPIVDLRALSWDALDNALESWRAARATEPERTRT